MIEFKVSEILCVVVKRKKLQAYDKLHHFNPMRLLI